ncbi:RelA/SpoT domain-containing protein [Janthinobacterium violaceinigrum]|uniref:(P)ppGpp synthetase n=1 Tax=Janthinobacterium violaceinigrum TaxID=2654252 RepID=A0A6I1HVQ0_9BURK|nr:RelA/SpoT domain-containing protein [Janthinobacterium violaceinigrum]KAB8060466.1 (p)ppGpp synthetase [Janthinobacterium violaceinigrum]
MAWITPKYTVQQVNAAGKMLVLCEEDDYFHNHIDEYLEALEAINNFRASHAFPLNTLQINLRSVARRFGGDALIAQRIKRMASISQKLVVRSTMKLSQMQDLGGCRAIVHNIATVKRIEDYYLSTSGIKHSLASHDDYILCPKASGYRGIHLIYRYYSDKNEDYNGMKIELQVRSRYQHAWATAVETVGMFSGQALKSSLGSAEWQRFFSLMGSAIALREGGQIVPGTPADRTELIAELSYLAGHLQVESRLTEFNRAVHAMSNGDDINAFYYLLQLDPERGTLMVTGYAEKQKDAASVAYMEAEERGKTKPGNDAVLVSVESVGSLAKAYPNYFADTRVFLSLLRQSLSGKTRGIKVADVKLQQFSLFGD